MGAHCAEAAAERVKRMAITEARRDESVFMARPV
jgi:hypothetical protein